MNRTRGLTGLLGAALVLLIGLGTLAVRQPYPFPSLSVTLTSPISPLSDFIGVAFGFRKLMADVAWIQTLIYYGTSESGTEEEESGGGNYPQFLTYCQRVSRLDPSFKYVYFYGGGVLGWNLNRLDEAEILLKEGISAHPKEWRYQQFLAGLAYQKSHDINKLSAFLQGFVEDKDCPNVLRSILANIFKKQHRYRESIYVWMLVYNTHDPSYFKRADAQIREMAPLAR